MQQLVSWSFTITVAQARPQNVMEKLGAILRLHGVFGDIMYHLFISNDDFGVKVGS